MFGYRFPVSSAPRWLKHLQSTTWFLRWWSYEFNCLSSLWNEKRLSMVLRVKRILARFWSASMVLNWREISSNLCFEKYTSKSPRFALALVIFSSKSCIPALLVRMLRFSFTELKLSALCRLSLNLDNFRFEQRFISLPWSRVVKRTVKLWRAGNCLMMAYSL